jgi:hypothetical protein
MIGPVLEGVESNHPFGPRRIYVPEQEQFYPRSPFGEDAEINAVKGDGGPQRKTASRTDLKMHGFYSP